MLAVLRHDQRLADMAGGNAVSASTVRRWVQEVLRLPATRAPRLDRALKKIAPRGGVVVHGAGLGIDVEIVERNPQVKGFVPQPKRWRVEQTYGILILHRRLVRDYEHRPPSSVSRVYWAMTPVMTRRLTGANAPTWREAQAAAA